MSEQAEFKFDTSAGSNGYQRWVTARRTIAEELGRRLNLPLGHRVEVWLRDGLRLRGELRFKDEFLIIEEDRLRKLVLVTDGVTFTYPDIESCVRVDD